MDAGAAGSAGSGLDDDLDAELSRLTEQVFPVAVDVVSAVHDASRLVSRVAFAHGVSLSVSPSEVPCVALATPTAVRQLLLNLLVDLVGRATGGAVEIGTEVGDATVKLRFRARSGPNAPLIAPADSEARLSVVRRLAESQGGRVHMSTAGGEATPHRLLDVQPRSSDLPPTCVDVAVSLPSVDVTVILVIDDNPDVARLMRRYVQGSVFYPLQACSGQVALDVAAAVPVDVITLDLMMPLQDGWDLYQSLRANPATARVPIIACSVLPERELALSLGVDDFLDKPITREKLLSALAPYRRQAGPGHRDTHVDN